MTTIVWLLYRPEIDKGNGEDEDDEADSDRDEQRNLCHILIVDSIAWVIWKKEKHFIIYIYFIYIYIFNLSINTSLY